MSALFITLLEQADLVQILAPPAQSLERDQSSPRNDG
jgi:hypothetical protein